MALSKHPNLLVPGCLDAARLRSAMPEPAAVCRPLPPMAATAVLADLPAAKDWGRAHLSLQREERRVDM